MIILVLLSVVITIAWIYLAISSKKADLVNIVFAKVRQNEYKQVEVTKKCEKKIHEAVLDGEFIEGKKIAKIRKKCDKQCKRLQRENDKLKAGKTRILDIISMTGYSFIRLAKIDQSNNKMLERLIKNYSQITERQNAVKDAYYTMASMIASMFVGAMLGICMTGLTYALGKGNISILIGLIVFIVCFIIGYIPYDEINEKIRKRQEEIEFSFPNVMSKLTLLIASGIEVSKAWSLTANSGKGVLYEEMKKTDELIYNGQSQVEAYSRFISVCSSKYATKLATAILQNLTKGNAEIVGLFKQITDESWMERKHLARRQGEKAQSKLIIPIMMMFVGIMILVAAPLLEGFGSMGF